MPLDVAGHGRRGPICKFFVHDAISALGVTLGNAFGHAGSSTLTALYYGFVTAGAGCGSVEVFARVAIIGLPGAPPPKTKSIQAAAFPGTGANAPPAGHPCDVPWKDSSELRGGGRRTHEPHVAGSFEPKGWSGRQKSLRVRAAWLTSMSVPIDLGGERATDPKGLCHRHRLTTGSEPSMSNEHPASRQCNRHGATRVAVHLVLTSVVRSCPRTFWPYAGHSQTSTKNRRKNESWSPSMMMK